MPSRRFGHLFKHVERACDVRASQCTCAIVGKVAWQEMNYSFARSRLKYLFIAFIFAVLGFTLLAGYVGIPDEDAAILYSYSRNLADTGVISYFPGGERVEGATDFGWMLSIAFLQKVGLSNHASSGLLNTSFLLLFGYRLLEIKRMLHPKVNSLNLFVAFSAFLAIIYGSGVSISGLGGFSTIAQISMLAIIYSSCLFKLYDVFFLGTSIYYVLLRPDSLAYYIAIVGSYLLVDIVIYSFQGTTLKSKRIKDDSSIGLATSYFKKDATFRRCFYSLIPILVFVTYWLLRWFYFRKPFPLPYYVKQAQENSLGGSAVRFLKELLSNEYNNLSVSIAVLVCLLLCVMSVWFFDSQTCSGNELLHQNAGKSGLKASGQLKLTPHQWVSGLTVFALFFAYQSLYLSRFNLIQNVWDRFHAPLLSVSATLLCCFLLVYSARLPIRGRRSFCSVLLIASLIIGFMHSTTDIRSVAAGYKGYLYAPYDNNIYPLSIDLLRVRNGQNTPTMFVTEAGRLSYYSRIPSIDTWGLNTPEYSMNPLQNPADVSLKLPDIINMHVDFSRLSLVKVNIEDLAVGRSCRKSGDAVDSGYCGWHQMNQAIFDGASALGYESYLVPFNKGASMEDRHDLFMINPASQFAKKLSIALVSNNGFKVSNIADLQKYRF